MFVVIGANGYVGSYIIKNILESSNENIIAISRTIMPNPDIPRVICLKCDLTKADDVAHLNMKLKDLDSIKVVYLAAYHHPDQVKKNPELAWDINITSLSRFLNGMPRFKCLFYISTEMVYGAGCQNHHFKETDSLTPVNLYGIQKKVAEAIVLGYGYNVIRFPFIIGPSLLPNRRHFYDVIVETLKSGQTIEMFADAYKSALDFNTAASIVVELINAHSDNLPTILNVCGDEDLSKFEIGNRIAEINHLDSNLIIPIKLTKDNHIFSETRASCTLMDNTLVKQILNRQEIKLKF